MIMSEFCCDIGDIDFPELISVNIRKAIKKHICTECGGFINPGDKYEHVRLMMGGHWDTYKTCDTCLNVRKIQFCGNWICGNLYEDLSYCLDMTMTELIGDPNEN